VAAAFDVEHESTDRACATMRFLIALVLRAAPVVPVGPPRQGRRRRPA
jgi:hypothetical protein